jgi:hypothetical protein
LFGGCSAVDGAEDMGTQRVVLVSWQLLALLSRACHQRSGKHIASDSSSSLRICGLSQVCRLKRFFHGDITCHAPSLRAANDEKLALLRKFQRPTEAGDCSPSGSS